MTTPGAHTTAEIPPRLPRRHLVRALATAGVLIVSMAVIVATVLYSSYGDTLSRELTNLRNLAQAYAAEVHYAAKALQLRAGPPGVPGAAPNGCVIQRPAPAARQTPTLPPGPVVVGIENVDPRSGRATITLSTGPASQVRCDSRYFEQIFLTTDLGSGGSVTLLHRDGTMLVRGPTLPAAIGTSFLRTPLFERYLPRAPQGAFEAISPTDGLRRLYGYATVDEYPLVIITGRDSVDALEVWFHWLLVGAAVWLAFSATMVMLARRIAREASRQDVMISRLEDSEASLAHAARYLTSIIDALATPIWVIDSQRRVLLSNAAFGDFSATSSLAQLYSVMDGQSAGAAETTIADNAGGTRTVLHIWSSLKRAGQDEQSVHSMIDMTELRLAEERIDYIANFDLLTELPNQARLRCLLGEFVHAERDGGSVVALLIISLERLGEVWDLLGQDAGEQLVRHAAVLLREAAGPGLLLARIKPTEFAAVVRQPSGAAISAFAVDLQYRLAQPMRVGDREFNLAPVIGISLYAPGADHVDDLLRRADIAKHRARADSSEPVQFYSVQAHTLLNQRLAIEEQLQHALERAELYVVYQPKVGVADGRIAGFEALLRWSNPVLGEVAPARFIPVAEETGLIVPIGNWVLRTVCAQAARWGRELGAPVKVAVNLSMRQFFQKDLVDSIAAALAASGLAAEALELEITESIAMSRFDIVEQVLYQLRQLGIELAIDDFGTGYSSLAYLKRFPVQCLKIDRAFIHDLGRATDSGAIVETIITLAHGLRMRVVAEGVEDTVQLGLLAELACDQYQGYLYSRPLGADAVAPLLRSQNPSPKQ